MPNILERPRLMERVEASDISPLAGKPAPKDLLVDLTRLQREYFDCRPDVEDASHHVIFGKRGHRGPPFYGTFTEAYILATTQAICDNRRAHEIDGPLYMGRDTHALSGPVQRITLEVLAANDVETTGWCDPASRHFAGYPDLQSRP